MNKLQFPGRRAADKLLLAGLAGAGFLLALLTAVVAAWPSPPQVAVGRPASLALISGDLAYTGAVTGTHMVWVGAFTTTLGVPPVYAMMRSGPGPYTLTVAAGVYHLYAGMDADDSGGPPDPAIDPMGGYALNPLTVTAGAVITAVDILLADPPPPAAGSISGRIATTGVITGTHNIVIFAGRQGDPGPPAHAAVISGAGVYTIPHLSDGDYLVGAFIDLGGVEAPPQPDEPFGWYDPTGDGQPDVVAIRAGGAATGIDIGLRDRLPHTTLLPRVLSSSPPGQASSPGFKPQSVAYYIRPDGGSAEQCTGRANAAYPGSGLNQPCAWDHPFRGLPPMETPRIAGGDTLFIAAGSYRMGYGAPGADACDAAGAFDCLMSPIPGGPDAAHPTRILGDSKNPPELWGAERPWFILNLTDSSNLEIGYLEITDHSGCVEFHSSGLACARDAPPYGDWAGYGLHAEDAANVYLHDLDIHGLAAGGVHAGRLTDWTVERVRIAGNGWVGWDGDLWDEFGDSNAGNLIFRRWTVEWNGCGETWPGQQPTGCWPGQSAGGYGDGVATGESGGRWLIEDSVIRYNTSDGLDFLYIRAPGSSIAIRRTKVEGNAGNQVKTYRGPFTLENSILAGNCGFFAGQPFTHDVDHCRALGDALALGLTAGDQVTVTHNTFTSEGDCLVTAECYGGCNGSERARLRNNIFQGQTDFLQPLERTCLIYQETFPANPFDLDYSLINGVKNDLCLGDHDLCGLGPGLASTAADSFDAHLLAGSPAIDAGLASAAPLDDFDGRARDAQPDLGAYEYGEFRIYLLLIMRTS